jgi:hypothetical protein
MRTVPRRASGRYFHTAPIIFNVCFRPYLLTVEYLCGSRLHDSLDFRHDRQRGPINPGLSARNDFGNALYGGQRPIQVTRIKPW